MAVVSLDIGIMEFAKTLDIAVPIVCEKITLDLWEKITMKTPVDTGRARASWQLATGAPSAYVPPSQGTPSGKHKNDAKPPGEPAAAFPSDVAITGDDIIFITSSLPYIEALEGGHSKQAIAGMVEVAIAEVQAEIQLTLEAVKAQLPS